MLVVLPTLRSIRLHDLSCFAYTSKISLRKHPFLHALRRWGRFARRNVCAKRPRGEERGETDAFPGYEGI